MNRPATVFAIMISVLGLSASDATQAAVESCAAMEQGTNRMGQDYRNFSLPDPDPAQCQAACAGESRCKAWTYVKPGVQGAQARCWLKHSVPAPTRDGNCVSGLCGTAAPRAQVGAGGTGPVAGSPPATATPGGGIGPNAPSGWPSGGMASPPPTGVAPTGGIGPTAPSGWPSSGAVAPSAGSTGPVSPSGSAGERNVTRRDLPSGPMPLGGETRFDGTTFTVQSSTSHLTTTEISREALRNFRAGVEVTLIGGGEELAGLVVSEVPGPEGKDGDIFFGVHRGGVTLQQKQPGRWRELPVQSRALQPGVRLEVERRGDRYEFLWNGAKVGEFTGDREPMRVKLFAGKGVNAQFRKFNSTDIGDKVELPSAPARSRGPECGWGLAPGLLGTGGDPGTCYCGEMPVPAGEAAARCGPKPGVSR